jgi:Ni,Fe-hydrogenase I cytochrome b subunit
LESIRYSITGYYKENGFNINIVLLCGLLIISLLFVNRSFVIGTSMGIMSLLFLSRKIRFTSTTVAVALFASMLLLLSIAFFVKSDSTLGRMFIYKVSWNIFKENWLSGIGLGNFQVRYGLYQAKYFSAGTYGQKEFLLADNVFYAFNDYWQFIIETGLVGLAALTASLYLVTMLVKRRLNEQPADHFLKLVVAVLILVCGACLFTHVMEKEFFQLGLVCIFFYLLFGSSKRMDTVLKFWMLTAILMVAVFLQHSSYLLNIGSYQKFETAKTLFGIGYVSEGRARAEGIYPMLADDVEFLIFYGDALTAHYELRQAKEVYQDLLKKRTDYRLYLKMADLCAELGLESLAEENYLTATNMVPNRFATRYALFSFYIKNNSIEKARNLGRFILNMPIKIPSDKIDRVRRETAKKTKILGP